MSRSRRVVASLAAALGSALLLAPAASAAAPRPVAPADLTKVRAKQPVRDAILPPRPLGARAAAATTQSFADPQGRRINISTDVEGLDLSRHASILAGTLHGKEIEALQVRVVPAASVAGACEAPEALACYTAENPARSPRGRMIVPDQAADLAHIVVHEYGHHVDNQLINIGHLSRSCNFAGDGSRNWFFIRDAEDGIVRRGFACQPRGGYVFLLAELFAEDYSAANGIRDWVLPSVNPPSARVTAAIRGDIARPFVPRRRRAAGLVRPGRSLQRQITVRDWTLIGATLSASGGANLDLYLYRAGRSAPLRRSTKGGSSERVRRAVPPGRYRVTVRSRGGTARARLLLELL